MVNMIIQCDSITELAKTKAMLDSQCFEGEIKVLMTNSLWKDIRKSISPINEERPDIKKVLGMDIIPVATTMTEAIMEYDEKIRKFKADMLFKEGYIKLDGKLYKEVESEDRLKYYQPKEVKPIYDAKDPESNRKHIIEDMY